MLILEINSNIIQVDLENFVAHSIKQLQDNDILVLQGAGSVGNFARDLKAYREN